MSLEGLGTTNCLSSRLVTHPKLFKLRCVHARDACVSEAGPIAIVRREFVESKRRRTKWINGKGQEKRKYLKLRLLSLPPSSHLVVDRAQFNLKA